MRLMCAALAGVAPLHAMAADGVTDRALRLMSHLEVAGTNRSPSAVITLELRENGTVRFGAYTLLCRKTSTRDQVTVSRIELLDSAGRVTHYGNVLQGPSSEEVRLELFRDLSANSMPMELLLRSYEVKQDGMGELCVGAGTYDSAAKTFTPDRSRVGFQRGTIAVSLTSVDRTKDANRPAEAFDAMLLETPVPVLANPTLNDGTFRVAVAAALAQTFVLEHSDSLLATNWTALPPATGDGATNLFIDPKATGPQRFYRLRRGGNL